MAEGAPEVTSGFDVVWHIMERSITDLASLRLQACVKGNEYSLPAAGLPWFMTLFGRDTLITAYQSCWVGPRAGPRRAAGRWPRCRARSATTSRTRSPARSCTRSAQGELTQLGAQAAQPLLRHGGRHAAVADPALGVLAVDRRRRAGPRRLAPNAMAALEWIDQYGDRDGDGYVEYADPVAAGPGQPVLARLLGRRAVRRRHDPRTCRSPPASSRATSTTRSCGWPSWPTAVWDDPALADAGCAPRPMQLGERFNEDFWIDERGGYYASGWTATSARSTR